MNRRGSGPVMPTCGPPVPPQGRSADRSSRTRRNRYPRRCEGIRADGRERGKSRPSRRRRPAALSRGWFLAAAVLAWRRSSNAPLPVQSPIRRSGILDGHVERADVSPLDLVGADIERAANAELEALRLGEGALALALEREVGDSHRLGPADPRQGAGLVRDLDI